MFFFAGPRGKSYQMSDPKARSQIGPYYTFSERKKPHMVPNYGSKYLGLVACFRGMRTIFQGNIFVLKFNIDTQKDAIFEAVSIHFPSPRIICWVSSNSHHQDDVVQVFRLGNPNFKTLHFAAVFREFFTPEKHRYQHFSLSQQKPTVDGSRSWQMHVRPLKRPSPGRLRQLMRCARLRPEWTETAGGSGPKLLGGFALRKTLGECQPILPVN